jgi:hypothetical protein
MGGIHSEPTKGSARRLIYRNNGNAFAMRTILTKLHTTVYRGKESIVATLLDVTSGMNPGTTLSDQYGAGSNEFSGIVFYTQPLGNTVTAIIGTSDTFLMSHYFCPFLTN